MKGEREREREREGLIVEFKEIWIQWKFINSINISCLFDGKMMSWQREWVWLKRMCEVETPKRKEIKNFVTLR